jgi:hypothetical protein
MCCVRLQDQMSQKEKLAALAEDVEQVDWDQFVVKGTQQELEKSYFRLTSAPAPHTVRPEAVLRRALDRLVHLLRQGKENYFYALDQFKGMRQDCTVQHLRNDLTVRQLAISPLHPSTHDQVHINLLQITGDSQQQFILRRLSGWEFVWL